MGCKLTKWQMNVKLFETIDKVKKIKFVAVKDLNITCTLLSLVDNIYFRPKYAVSLTDTFSLME